MVTLAPATTVPFSPVTVPLILRVCAKAMVVINARNVTNKSPFLIMSVLVNKQLNRFLYLRKTVNKFIKSFY
jgi:hypothetical protein